MTTDTNLERITLQMTANQIIEDGLFDPRAYVGVIADSGKSRLVRVLFKGERTKALLEGGLLKKLDRIREENGLTNLHMVRYSVTVEAEVLPEQHWMDETYREGFGQTLEVATWTYEGPNGTVTEGSLPQL